MTKVESGDVADSTAWASLSFFQELAAAYERIPLVGQMFLCGCLGSVIAEVLAIVDAIDTKNEEALQKYRSIGYWFARSLLVFFAGLVPIWFDANTGKAAVALGLSAPYYLDVMSRGYRTGKKAVTRKPSAKSEKK